MAKNPVLVSPAFLQMVDETAYGHLAKGAMTRLKRLNPIKSAKQYGLMQAVAHGSSKVGGVSKKVAKEMIKATPSNVRSKFAKELLKNPLTVDEAAELSKEWHGREPLYETEVEEVETYPSDMAELADLEELGVITPDLNTFQIYFKRNRPKLAAENKSQLAFIGGDQSLDNVPDLVGYEVGEKRLVPLGYVYQIVYETDKHHLEGSNGVMESYEHYFCEEEYKGVANPDDFKNSDDWFDFLMEDGIVVDCIERQMLPLLIYNITDKKLVLAGGVYTVKDVGITN